MRLMLAQSWLPRRMKKFSGYLICGRSERSARERERERERRERERRARRASERQRGKRKEQTWSADDTRPASATRVTRRWYRRWHRRRRGGGVGTDSITAHAVRSRSEHAVQSRAPCTRARGRSSPGSASRGPRSRSPRAGSRRTFADTKRYNKVRSRQPNLEKSTVNYRPRYRQNNICHDELPATTKAHGQIPAPTTAQNV
jgi:hypothetical protein